MNHHRIGRLSTWNLDAHDFRSIITIEGNRTATGVADRQSLFFCGARLSDFHGLLVNMDPTYGYFRLWDLDAGGREGEGSRFLAQRDDAVWLTTFSSTLRRVQPLRKAQIVWELGFIAAGLAILPDGTLMMPSSGTPSGYVHRLTPWSGLLTTWRLPEEPVPFSGVATPAGDFFLAERSLSRIARLDPRSGVLREWQLPSGMNPQIISRDRLGRIWLSDANFNNHIARLNPSRGTLALYVKEGLVTFSARPVDPLRLGLEVGAADLLSYVDLLRASPIAELPVPIADTLLSSRRRRLRSFPSRAPVSSLFIEPSQEFARPVDPPEVLRYPTPVVTPVDLTEHHGAIFATAGVFDEHRGPSRIFRLEVPVH